MANLNYNKFFEDLSDQDMGVLGVALDEIQEKCDFCRQGTTELLRSIAKDLIICQQITGACRRLTDKETTGTQEGKTARLALMATKRADIVQWDDLFQSRTRGVCKLCQVQTQEAVDMWQLGKRLWAPSLVHSSSLDTIEFMYTPDWNKKIVYPSYCLIHYM